MLLTQPSVSSLYARIIWASTLKPGVHQFYPGEKVTNARGVTMGDGITVVEDAVRKRGNLDQFEPCYIDIEDELWDPTEFDKDEEMGTYYGGDWFD